jgi:hypothetical protein
VEFAFLDLHVVGSFSSLATPEFSDELNIFRLADVEFSPLVVFELRMVQDFCGNTFASE